MSDIDELTARLLKEKSKIDSERARRSIIEKGNAEDDEDDTDALLSKAIEMALQEGKGWKPGEKEEYLKKILDDDFIPPLFATSVEEVEKSGLMEAFTSLQHDDPPEIMMEQCKKKGNEAFANGKRNVAKNLQVRTPLSFSTICPISVVFSSLYAVHLLMVFRYSQCY